MYLIIQQGGKSKWSNENSGRSEHCIANWRGGNRGWDKQPNIKLLL